MTTKAEFDSFINGYKLGLGSSAVVSMSEFRSILSMVDDVIMTEIALAMAKGPPEPEPITIEAAQQPPVEDDAADHVPAMAETAPINIGSPIYLAPVSVTDEPTTPEHAPIIPEDNAGGSILLSDPTPEQASATAAEGVDPTVDVMASPSEISGDSGGGGSDSSV